MGEYMRLLSTKLEMTNKEVADTAYETKLGIHHNWLQKKACYVGLHMASSRENFVESYRNE